MGISVRDKYIQYRTNPDNDEKSDAFFCSTNCISLDEINELKSQDNKLYTDILKARRDTYAKKMSKIDSALFKAAEAGDTKAADLLYRRFDGWNPKVVEETNNYYNFTDMVKGLRKKKVTHIKREL